MTIRGRSPGKLSSYNVFKVIYAPHKVFKEVIQNPKYIGPILILILFVAADTASAYTLLAKSRFEQTVPSIQEGDKWIENATIWTPMTGVNITENTVDFINGTYYGNKSLQFSTANSNHIAMSLSNMGTVNCTGPDGYKNISIRIKWTSPVEKPNNVSFYLNSSTVDRFYYNLTRDMANSTANVWYNFTIPLATERWVNTTARASWSHITDLKLEFAWATTSNITVLLDGLFFRGVYGPFTTDFTAFLASFATRGLMQFVLRWIVLGGIIFIMTKALGGIALWRPALILAGFALMTMFIQTLINTATLSTLPTLYYSIEYLGGTAQEISIAQNAIAAETSYVTAIYGYVQIATYLWTIILSALATRLFVNFSWMKSFLVGTVAFLFAIIVEGFILGI